MAGDFPPVVLRVSRALFGASMSLWRGGQQHTAHRTQPRLFVDWTVYAGFHNTTAALPQRPHNQKSLKYS